MELKAAIENAKKNGIRDKDYIEFEDKFKPKLTTDDCFTPPAVYEAVREWAVNKYGLKGREIVRPFYPGGDYENYDYPDDCVVIDNPPFSIISKIADFYTKRKIHFFMFAPTLTLFNVLQGKLNYIITGKDVTYDNGAKIKTSFVTDMGVVKVVLSSTLSAAIDKADKTAKKELQGVNQNTIKYVYPDTVITAARLQKIASREIDLEIKDGVFIKTLEAQRKYKKTYLAAGC